jgi:hypothetical protein
MAERNRQHPATRALIYAVLLALVATGLLWKLDLERPFLMKIHGAAAMASMVLFGGVLVRHVPCGWKTRANRTSGASLLAAALWLVLSGYALYYAGSEPLRAFASQTHFWIGLALAAAFGFHLRSAG